MKKKTLFLLITLFAVLFVISCGNETNEGQNDDNTMNDNDQKTTDDADQTENKDWSCVADSCETHADCSCNSDEIACVPKEMANAPLDWASYNAERCTVINCDKNDDESCPEGYVCYDLPMYNELMKDATTMCIDIRTYETDDDDVVEVEDRDSSEDVDSITEDDTETDDSDEEIMVDEDEAGTVWPTCYDDPCKSSSECCEGTKCLPKIAETMDPNIHESEYCIVGDCTVGDATTCPPAHTCLQSTMGTYCVKD